MTGGGAEENSSETADMEESAIPEAVAAWPALCFDRPPRRLFNFSEQFGNAKENFLKGVKWAPDGSCFLTSSDDNSLRLFYLPEDASDMQSEMNITVDSGDSYPAALILKEAESVYDFCWYPYMSSLDITTCVFASTTKDHPIHLWDAISGQLRGTYRAYDAMDEITAALSVAFNPSGTKIFAGYNKEIRVFDLHCPGRDFEHHSLVKGDERPTGIVSSISFSPMHHRMLAVGSYNKTVTLYAEDNMEALYVLHGQLGGVTQVLFSKDGNYLYTGGRKDPYILCWDIRNTVDIVYKLYRAADNTNQRIYFDIEPCGRHLATGGQDGLIHVYDLQTGQWVTGFQGARDTVNGFMFHPYLPLAVSSSGNRQFSFQDEFAENSRLVRKGDENCCSIWKFSCLQQV